MNKKYRHEKMKSILDEHENIRDYLLSLGPFKEVEI